MNRQRIPLVALVGRPNVGKSTLFNRLTGRRRALVLDEPGVTRDRIFGKVHSDGRVWRLVDTGGLDLEADDSLLSGMRAQTQLAIDEADLVLLVVDADAGLTPTDAEVARMLRRGGKRAAVLANKADVPGRDALAGEFYALGLETVLPVSAEHARGIGDLLDFVAEAVSPPEIEEDEAAGQLPVSTESMPDETASRVEWKGGAIAVAVIGRPNAGKSSLINRLLGEERLLASSVAGTTRDPIDSHLRHDGQDYTLIDTAGIRRKRSIATRLEQFSVVAAFNAMDRADVAVMVVDGATRPTDQDARIAAMAHDKGKGLVIAINKWDLVENPEWRERYGEALRLQLPFADYAPVVKLSAKTGRGLEQLYAAILIAQQERHRRVGTGELNRFFRRVVVAHPPPLRGGRRPQLSFVSQPLVRPPTFVFASRGTSDLHVSYVRYLQNALRKAYGFAGTPIWLKFRARPPRDRSSAKQSS